MISRITSFYISVILALVAGGIARAFTHWFVPIGGATFFTAELIQYLIIWHNEKREQ